MSISHVRRALDEANLSKKSVEKMIVEVRARLAHKDEIVGQFRLEKNTATETRDRYVGEGNHLRQKVVKLQAELSSLRAKPDCSAELSAARADVKSSEESRVALAAELYQSREGLATFQGRFTDLMHRKNRVSSSLAAGITRNEQLRGCIQSVST